MITNYLFFWIQIYPIVSLFIFILVLAIKYCDKKINDYDKTDSLKTVKNNIEYIRELSPTIANITEYIVKELDNNNHFPMLTFILIICLIPFVRLLLLETILFE